jgi:hypothetical protein
VSLLTEGFKRIGTLTVPALGAGVTATNVPLVIRPQLEFTALMLSKIKQNGDDLRFSDDEAGDNELPKELVKFDKTTGDIVWSNFPSVVEGLAYHVWANNAAAIQPAPSAAFGRNAVWVNYAMVAHTESANLIDSTGNDTISAKGAITTGITGAIGDGVAFSATDIGITKDTSAGINFSSGYTFSFWANFTGDNNYAGFLRNSGIQLIKDKDLPNLRVEHNDGTTSTRAVIPNGYSNLVVFNALHRYTLTWDVSTFSSYRDGVLIDTISQTRGVSVTGETNFTYEVGNAVGFTASLYDESFVRNGHSDADRVSIEDQNQLATTAWWIAADVGGDTSYELTPETGTFTYTGSSVALLANRALTPQSGTFTYSGGSTSLAYNRAMTITGATYAYSADPIQLLVNRVLNIETGTFNYSGGAVTLEYSQVTGFYELTPEPGIFNYSGSAVDLLHNRTLTPDTGAFAYTADPLNLAYNRAFTPETGTFAYSGDSISFARNYALSITGGVFNYSGGSITLNYSGEVITLMSNYTMSYATDSISINYAADSITANYLGD